ncbi:DNA topoisomerase I [Leptolyngbya sp. 'hensonii']|uniref:type I DNA topoisomerase n=1 Tax=Leptolyngbya sp. 'hensonii' TaxID=1922337 RepID=UPI00094FD0C4|nr:type I DNA topoisomerase [Leptolyngbya sp. 'hensonii']OLP20056.1 DNA topoisomerase I [Leptolyngbya sp. 'hensonii']
MANLLLIESPGKSRKLSQILGQGWIVKASLGHIRELANDGEDALGFDLNENQVECRYEPRGARAKQVLAELRQVVKQADRVYIATDPDREGETIGWHLQQELRLKNPQRVVYSEITPAAVQRAIAHPRPLDQALIGAGRARDCLDKLVGYRGSKHLVWKLNNGAKSMGRVQSATLHLLCQREREIQTFKPQDYWMVWVEYREGFKALYRKSLTPRKQAPTVPSEDAAESQDGAEGDRVTTQAEADRLVAIARSQPHQIVKVDRKTTPQSPPPPFITSTLQQAAGAKLHFSPDQTMKIAQSLYEAGHITYMRTDSVMLSEQFCIAVRQYLEQEDPTNVPARTTRHRSKQQAQEAHEAIRPTEVNQTPQLLQARVSADAARLYELIWHRAVASQCAPVQIAKTRIVTQSGEAFWEARGQVVTFPGYTRYWNNLSADVQLPNLNQGQAVTLIQAGAEAKQTQPPPRYTEPKLVQLMERQGIGRPSTYAPTIKTLKERDYVQGVKGKLQPTPLGLELDAFLQKVLPDLIQPEFTAQMESSLDAIAAGKEDWQTYLTQWNRNYFAPALAQAIQKISSSVGRPPTPPASPQSAKTTQKPCPKCGQSLVKVPSKSTKIRGNHFLACDRKQGGCGAALFWNPKLKQYELPYSQRTPDPEALTDFPCPGCRALLERYAYTKEGKTKVMLRCAIPEHRQGKCKDVAFFEGRDGFWSPKFGILKTPALTVVD